MGLFGKKKADKKAGKKAERKDVPSHAERRKEISYAVSEEDAHTAQYMAMLAEQTQKKRALSLLSLSMIANLALICACVAVFWWGIMYKRDIYFMTTPDGQLQEMIPLTQPYISTAGIANWTAQAVTQTYTLDFRNWRQTLAKVRHYYSQEAWNQLDRQIRPLISQLTNERLMLYAVADEAPRLLAEGLYDGRIYVWRLEFPMTITHQLAKSTRTFKWNVRVLVGRANTAEKMDGVEILQFIITPR